MDKRKPKDIVVTLRLSRRIAGVVSERAKQERRTRAGYLRNMIEGVFTTDESRSAAGEKGAA